MFFTAVFFFFFFFFQAEDGIRDLYVTGVQTCALPIFVRGDAVAGILIMVINIIGGLCIGTMMHGLPMADATKTYTLLTIDRKSTRLNSSHVEISYAVFCLKKKNKNRQTHRISARHSST